MRPQLEELEPRLVPSNYDGIAATYALGGGNVIRYLNSEALVMLHRPLGNAEDVRIANAVSLTPLAARPLLAQQLLVDMATSAEFIGGRNAHDWVKRLFVGVLHREGSPAEVEAWTQRATVIGLGVATEFEFSIEKHNQHVRDAYLKILGRLPGDSEYAGWTATLPLAVDLYAAGSAEAYSYHPDTITTGMSDHNYEEWLEYTFGGDDNGQYQPY